jgi:methyl-accepting chemotaxis protein
MGHIRTIYPELVSRGAKVVVILAQKRTGIAEFLKDHEYPFPLLSDERRQVVKEWGVYVAVNFESFNIARPAEFILDPDGVIKLIHIGSIQTDFPTDSEVLPVFDKMKDEAGGKAAQ